MKLNYPFALAGAALSVLTIGASAQAQTCVEIASVPTVISLPGVYCLKKDLNFNAATGTAITVNANSVIIDMNGFKLGGVGAGANTLAYGIASSFKVNVTIRNGAIRGFYNNIYLNGGNANVVEDMRIDGARANGIYVSGLNMVVRDNFVTSTGNGVSTSAAGIYVDTGEGATITGNMITAVEETSSAFGIIFNSSNNGIIDNNQIRDVFNAGGAYGISISSGARNVLRNNVVTNSVGSFGISAFGSGDICIGNLVSSGFTTPFSSCEISRSNETF